MKYTIYKLEFQTGVHFGTGALDEGTYTFHADQIFSAMYIEALKLGIDQKFYDAVKAGTLLFSDALPYMGQQYMIPKPMIYVTSGRQGESEQKKAYKKLKYLPVEQLDEFLKGSINFKADVMKDYGQLRQQTMAERGRYAAVSGGNLLLCAGMRIISDCCICIRRRTFVGRGTVRVIVLYRNWREKIQWYGKI